MTHRGSQVTYELALRLPAGRKGPNNKPGLPEILKEILISAGFGEGEIVEIHDGLRLGLAVYLADAVRARAVKRALLCRGLTRVTVELKRLQKKDWVHKGRDELKPFPLGRGFIVIPEHWRKPYRLRGRQPIFIDYGMIFGTGHHATTRFTAELIEACRGRFDSFLDVGTGTGILSMIASKCGARNVTALDISPEAIAYARQHLRRNGCSPVELLVMDFRRFRARRFDLVAANLITPDLIAYARKLLACVKPGKYLAVSGISFNLYPLFREEFIRYSLRCLKILKGEGWAAILFKKNC